MSFVGTVIAFGLPTPAADPHQMLGDLMMVGGAAAWAATTLVIKASPLNRVSAEKTMLYQLVVSAPLLAAAALVYGEHITAMPSALALVALVYQAVLGGERYLCGLVRARRALFGQQIVGLYLPDPPIWRRRRPSRPQRAADPALRPRGCVCRVWLSARKPAAVRLYRT